MNRIFNLKLITSFLGLSIMLNGLVMLLTTPVELYFEEECWLSIAASGALTLTLGFFMWFLNRDAVKNLQSRDGYLIVVLGWLMLTLTGTLPYVISGSIPIFTDAFFETMSGFTTTGSTILNDIESLPKSILFWRSMTQWIGGMGIIVLTIAILPLLGIGGMELFIAESPGPTKDKIHPRIKETA